MGDFHSFPTYPKARKQHHCIWCGGPIPIGEQYVQQTGFYEGAAYRNRFHKECRNTLAEQAIETGEWEFMPGEGEMPPRIAELARQSAAQQPTGQS